MKKQYEVVLYDLWENEEGKWVNDVLLTGIHIELSPDFDIPEVAKELDKAGFENIQEEFSIDHGSFGDRFIYFLDNMGDPYFELREVEA